jgi:chromosome segregation ATPase
MNELDTIFDKARQSLAGFDQLQTDAKLALAKSRRELEETNKALAEAQHDHQKLLAEIAAKKAEADASSEEAARRIQTGNEQVAELMRVKSELAEWDDHLHHRAAEFEKSKRDLDERAKAVSLAEVDYGMRHKALAAREQKLREAMS